MKILLVDDSEQTTNSLAAIIGRRGIGEIRVAYKGDDAVRIAAEFKPDVVVLDIDLPVLNGFEVLEEFKKRSIDTRVILLSGVYTDTEHVVRCIRAGACDFLKKPSDTDTIINSIQRHFLLENADNLRLYAQAPGLIKQLIDRADEEERLARNSEIRKLVERAKSAEKKLERVELESTKAKGIRGRFNELWKSLSPNERAAYITLFGGITVGILTCSINFSAKLMSPSNDTAHVSYASSQTLGSNEIIRLGVEIQHRADDLEKTFNEFTNRGTHSSGEAYNLAIFPLISQYTKGNPGEPHPTSAEFSGRMLSSLLADAQEKTGGRSDTSSVRESIRNVLIYRDSNDYSPEKLKDFQSKMKYCIEAIRNYAKRLH